MDPQTAWEEMLEAIAENDLFEAELRAESLLDWLGKDGFATLLLTGCSAPEGSEAAARAHLDGEFHKWISDQESEVATMNYRLHTLQTPIDYEIRRVVTDKPDL